MKQWKYYKNGHVRRYLPTEGFVGINHAFGIVGNESEDRIRQLFMVFFPIFARNTARSQEMIEAAFIPVMRVLNDAQLGSPEADISHRDVAAFLIDHTKPGTNRSTSPVRQ